MKIKEINKKRMSLQIRAMKRNQTEQSVRGFARASREEGAILGLFPPRGDVE